MNKKNIFVPLLIAILLLALAAVQGCGKPAAQTPQAPAVKDIILATGQRVARRADSKV